MAIEITGLSGSHIAPANDQGKVQTEAHPITPAAATPVSADTDTVRLTDRAALLRQVENSLATVPVVDTERVASIKSELRQGQYVVDPVRVADKMLRFESMLAAKD